MSDIKKCFIPFVVKSVDEAKKVISFRGTTESPDHVGDVIVADGGDYTDFAKNPVFLWVHDWEGKNLPIGKVLSWTPIPTVGVDYDVQFDAKDPFAMEVFRKYSEGYLNAVSVGIKPLRAEDIKDSEGKPVWPPAFKYEKWAMIELSGCPIPQNPDALQHGYDKFVQLMSIAAPSNQTPEDFLDSLLAGKVEDVEKGALSFADLPIASKDTPWDGSKARQSMEKRANGSPSKLKQGFLWVDGSKDPKLIGSYKLPIADVIGGELKAVPKGLHAAAQRMSATQIPDADKAKCKSTLKKYYSKMGETVPWEKSLEEGDEVVTEKSDDAAVTKLGAVLNSENKNKLQEAISAIQAVLASAESKSDEAPVTKEETPAMKVEVAKPDETPYDESTTKVIKDVLDELGLSEEEAIELLAASEDDFALDGEAIVREEVEKKLRYLAGKVTE